MAVLCRDAVSGVHTLAWGVIQNRTTTTFRRFFHFVKASFPSIKVFMCDRHFAQRKAIKEVFGESVSVFHCCVHLARNIKSNCGPNTDLVSKFWEMRYRRTKEAEYAFVAALERLHESRRSLFTTELLNSLPSFVPPTVDPVLKKDLFPALTVLRGFAEARPPSHSTTDCFVKSLVQGRIEVGRVDIDIFIRDNTNVIEGYFNGIKSRMQKRLLSLHDVFNAVDLTERQFWLRERLSPQNCLDHFITVSFSS